MNHALKQAALLQTLTKIAETRKPGPLPTASGQYLSGGLEVLAPGTPYRWDGLRRGIDAAHPFVVFQYTLAGWGAYAEGGATQRLTPGAAFAAVLPSAHVYHLPPDSPGWTFCWVMFNHPYVVGRVRDLKAEAGPVTELAPDGVGVARLVRLFEGACQGGFGDAWAQEAALFEFLWEYERHEHARRYAPPERERLLSEVRREVLECLDCAPDVARLARARGMSRSAFSHHFKAVTGLPPAHFVMQVRLEYAARRLRESAQTLEAIATEMGFANANHFGKVFRRHYHLSPGAFRRQMR